MDERAYIKNLFGVTCSPGEASSLLDCREWFENIAEFDRTSGEPLGSDIDRLCGKIEQSAFDTGTKNERRSLRDRLYRVCDYTRDSLRAITGRLRVSIRREHEVLPIYAARELDSASLLWLSQRPGRNVREKIADKHAILAVKRHQSIDTLENRLLKIFTKRLTEKLEERAEFFAPENELCADVLIFLRRWLGSEDAKEIGAWRNEPPNNTLLHDKHYHNIWRMWKTLQTMNEKVREDIAGLAEARLTVIFWTLLAALKSCDECRIIQQPVRVVYDGVKLTPALTASGISRNCGVWNANLDAESRKLIFNFPETDATHVLESSAGKLLLNNRPVLGSLKDAVSFLAKCLFKVVIDKTIKAKTPETKIDFNKVEYACIDICSTRPAYFIPGEEQKYFPFRMLRQEWKEHGAIDCGYSSAVLLHDRQKEIETISLRSVFFDENPTPAALNAASFFMEKIKEQFNTETGGNNESCVLHYIVPDWISELALTSINQTIHYSFKNAFPLPRSIAAVGAWQSSESFILKQVLVLVIDDKGSAVSVTPLENVFNEELAHTAPGTGCWHWERHPTFTLPFLDDETIRNFQNEGYNHECASKLLRLFGADALKKEADKISFLYDDQWNHISPGIEKVFALKTIALNNLLGKIRGFKINEKNYPVVILPLQEELQIDKKNGVTWLGSKWPLAKGAAAVADWQKQAGKIPFWRDHLPELSADFDKRRYLVKDFTAIPMRGSKQTWELDFKFKLDCGQDYYHFPLYQGEGEQTTLFEAYLKPPMPLMKDTLCKLEMTYTYGEDMPYALRFIPLPEEQAPFKSLEVIWQRLDEDTILDRLESPAFPPRKSWDDFKHFPNRDGTEDMLKRCVNDFRALEDIVEFDTFTKQVEQKKSARMEGKFVSGKLDKNNKYFCFAAIDDIREHNVFCHSRRFKEKIDYESIKEGCAVYFDLIQEENRNSGDNITFSEKCPATLYYDEIYDNIQKFLHYSRFPVLNIWNNGHSLSESDVPDEFRMAMFKIIENAKVIYRNENIPVDIRSQIFFFFCCLHRDAPGDLLMERFGRCFFVATDMRYHLRNIGLAIGDGRLKWQDNLFQSVLGLMSKDKIAISNAFEILAVALWRTESLVFRIPSETLPSMGKKLYDCLKDDMNMPVDRHKDDMNMPVDRHKDDMNTPVDRHKVNYALQKLCRHLEVLLALMHTRKFENKDVKRIFAPQSKLSSDFIKLLDALDTLLTKKGINMKSRIEFQVKIPEEHQTTNPLIYVLRLYLSGKSKEQHISILDVSDDDSQ